VNNKPCPSSNEEKIYAILASISTEYDVNRMDRGHYQDMLQNMKFTYPLFSLPVRTEEEIESDPITIDELFVLEDIVPEEITVRVNTPIKIKAGGNCSFLARGQKNLTLSKVIAGAIARFKRKGVSIPVETGMLSSFMEAIMMKIPLPPPNLDYIGCRCWDLYLGYFRGS
jgi:hypothetical protein